MTGQVLDYSIQTNEGIISGDDSQRYRFAGSDWPGASAPVRGTLVDFDIADGNRAVSIYLVGTSPASSSSPNPASQTASSYPAPSTAARKEKMTAALLALFAGMFGIHKFYLGEGGGVVRIILTCCMITAPVSGVLGLIDAIKLFQMSEADFDRQYNGGA